MRRCLFFIVTDFFADEKMFFEKIPVFLKNFLLPRARSRPGAVKSFQKLPKTGRSRRLGPAK